MQKKAVEEHEFEPPPPQQQQQRQQKGEKGAVEQAGWARLRRRGGTYTLRTAPSRRTHPVPRALHGGRCTAGSRCNRVPQASVGVRAVARGRGKHKQYVSSGYSGGAAGARGPTCAGRGQGEERVKQEEKHADEGDGRARAQAAAVPAQSSKQAPRMQNLRLAQKLCSTCTTCTHTHTRPLADIRARTCAQRTRAPTSTPAPAHLRTRTRTRIRRSCDTIPTLQHKPCSREHSAGATHRRPRTHARTRSPHTPRTGGGAGRFWSVLVVGARTESRTRKK